MSDNSLSEGVTAELVSDEQVDNFFENGGEVESQPEQEAQPTEQPEQQQEDTEALEADRAEQQKQQELENNYKRMAHEEREKRRQLEQQFKENQERIARMEQVYSKLVEQHTQQNQPHIPSFDEDPLENIRSKQENIEKQLQYQQQLEQQRLQQAQHYQRTQDFINQYKQSASEYTKETPDFTDAYNHLTQSRLIEYKEAGYTNDEALRLLHEDEMAIAAKAFAEGANPAERLYKLAKLRGYQKPEAAAKETNTAKLEQLEKGVKAAKSLSSVGGKAAGGTPSTLEELASMSDEEIDKHWAKVIGSYS